MFRKRFLQQATAPGTIVGTLAIILICSTGLLAAATKSLPPASIYLAGPLGFSDAGRVFKDQVLIPQLTHLGFQVLDPWKLTNPAEISRVSKLPYGTERRDAWKTLNAKIGENNESAIRRSNLVVANLDGTDVDSGTAAEIGYAYALHKPIIGYRGDFRLSADNEGSTVNVQVEHFIRASGGSIITSLDQLPGALSAVKAGRSTVSHQSYASSTDSPTTVPTNSAPSILDVIAFFERVFGIVLALALAEAFKKSVKDEGSGIVWEKLWALGSFLLLILPFFQGMNRYFFVTYGDLAHIPKPCAGYLMFDGLIFTFESAIFFVMSRALEPDRWRIFYLSVLALLFADSLFAVVARYGHHAAVIMPWLILNVISTAFLAVGIVAFRKSKTNVPAYVGLIAMFLRTTADYSLMWNFYFPNQ